MGEPLNDILCNMLFNYKYNVINVLMFYTYSTLHADSPLSAKLRIKFKLCVETRGGHYFGYSQNAAEFRGVDKIPRRNT